MPARLIGSTRKRRSVGTYSRAWRLGGGLDGAVLGRVEREVVVLGVRG